MAIPSDDLVRQMLHGDSQDDITECVRAFSDVARVRLLAQMRGRRTPGGFDENDVLQEAIFTFLRKRQSVDWGDLDRTGIAYPVRAYFLQVVNNKLLSMMKSELREPRTIDGNAQDLIATRLRRISSSVASQADRIRDFARLRTLLSGSKDDLECVAIYLAMSSSDASKLLGVQPGTVRVRFHRAKTRILEKIEPLASEMKLKYVADLFGELLGAIEFDLPDQQGQTHDDD